MTREERYIEQDERIDRYLRNQMGAQERADFEQEVEGNQELRERLVATSLLVQGISQVGMRREGQAQLDAIRQMSRDEFVQATQGKKSRRPVWSFMKWASGIAALAVIAYGLYTFYPAHPVEQAEMAQTVEKAHVKPTKPRKLAKPTLASLADEYNKPFGSEPDQFVTIRQQIKDGRSQDMMAVVYDIEKVEWPTAKHGPKGASDDEVIKELTDNYSDCTHWYKALAYLKAGDRESAVKELTELIEHGKTEDLVNRATALLKKLK